MNAVVPIKRLDRADGLAVSEKRFLIDPNLTPWTYAQSREVIGLTDGYSLSPDRARRALAIAPDLQAVKSYISEVEIAATAKPEPRASIIMVGMLVDAFPNSRASGSFIDAATHDAVSMGFTPYEIAAACQAIRRTSKFLPSISEFLDACGKARDNFKSALYMAERLASCIERARVAIEEGGQ
jgi:hypothetical protein